MSSTWPGSLPPSEPPRYWPPQAYTGGPPPPTPAPRRRFSRSVLATIAAALILLLAAGFGGYGIVRALQVSRSTAGAGIQQLIPALGTQDAAAKVSPAVVDINTTVTDGFGRSGQAAGTGILLTSSGEILTNNHVVEGATNIRVTVTGRGSYTAKVLGVAPTKDIALVQLQGASGLPTAGLGDSGAVKVGDSVVAIGNALGQGGAPTVTHGTITALNRSITASDGSGSSEQLNGMIQTNASISPGDSGGALANSAGQVIGVITAGESRRFGRSSSTNIGFAVPSNTASQIAKQIESGRSDATVIIGTPGYLGVAVRDLDSNAAANLGLGITAGVLVVDVPSGSPAARLGIGANSVIIAIDGKQVNSSSDLGSAIHSHRPGEQIQVTWVNRSGTHNGTATLVSGPAA